MKKYWTEHVFIEAVGNFARGHFPEFALEQDILCLNCEYCKLTYGKLCCHHSMRQNEFIDLYMFSTNLLCYGGNIKTATGVRKKKQRGQK